MAPGAGYVTVHRAVAAATIAGIPLDALMALPDRQLVSALPIGQAPLAEALLACTNRLREEAAHTIQRVEEAGCQVLAITDADYPPRLAQYLGDQAPPLLFVAGDTELLARDCAGIVGARKATPHGCMLAEECARTFAESDVPVVSGGAAGVDSAAHNAVLEAGGATLVVLPQGLFTYKMPQPIAEALEDGRATVVSEFLPKAGWATHAAVTRNATISAFAKLVCVIEPRKVGGSIRTARCALDQGKRVLVHTTPDHDAAAVTLQRAGALAVLNGEGQYDARRVLDLWYADSERRAQVDPELF
jgi:DNA protecting protein DprA